MGVVDAFDDLILQPLLGVGGGSLQLWNAIDDVHREIEAVDLVEDGELERRVDIAFFLVTANVEVVVISPAVGELVDERGVGVEVEDDGLVDGEEAVELVLGEAVGVLTVGHEAEEVDDVDEADLDLGAALAEDGYRGEGFAGGNVAGAGHDNVRFYALVVARRSPRYRCPGCSGRWPAAW